MNTTRRISTNIGALVSSNVLIALATFILNILIARYLGDTEFGKYAFAVSFTALFATISHLGLDVIVTRDVARNRSQVRKYLGNVLVIESFLSLITLAVIFLIINLINYPSDTRIIIYLVSTAMVINSLTLVCRSIFQAFERMVFDTIIYSVRFVLLIGSSFLVLYFGYGLTQVVCVYALVNVVTLIFGIIIINWKFTSLKLEMDLSFWKYLLPTSIPFALNGLLLPIYARIDIVMLSFFKGEQVVGWYNAAFISVMAMIIIATGFTRALFPTLTIAFTAQTDEYTTLIQKSIRYSLILLLPIGVGVTLLSSRIINIIFGPAFIDAAGALKLLIWTGIFSFFNMFYINVMEATNKQKKATLILGIGALANAVLNLILIPSFSLIGAAIATLATQLSCFIVAHYVVGRIPSAKYLGRVVIRPLVASLIMGVLVFYLQNLHIVLIVLLSIVTYFLVLYLLREFTADDRNMLKRIIGKGGIKT